jgi:hypothetical protein
MNDLLKVLDMSEDEQWDFFVSHQGIQELCEHQLDNNCQKKFKRRVLADLAFRLRDEVIEQNLTMWQRAMDIVFLKTNEEHWKEEHQFTRWSAVIFWFSHKAKPIHWIIAALIAKGKANA